MFRLSLLLLFLVSCASAGPMTFKVTYVVQASPGSIVTILDEHGAKVVGRMTGTSWSRMIVFPENTFASLSILSSMPSQCKIYFDELVESTGTNQCSAQTP